MRMPIHSSLEGDSPKIIFDIKAADIGAESTSITLVATGMSLRELIQDQKCKARDNPETRRTLASLLLSLKS